MKYIIVISFVLVSCSYSNKQVDVVLNDNCSKQLFAARSILSNVENIVFKQSDIKKRNIILPDSIKRLFENTEILDPIKKNKCFIYGIIKARPQINSICLLSEDISADYIYIVNFDCDYRLKDYLRFDNCDYFDAYTLADQSYEHATFQKRYFNYPNDTMFVTASVIREEKKKYNEAYPQERTIDSLSFSYIIDKDGKFILFDKDSIRTSIFR